MPNSLQPDSIHLNDRNTIRVKPLQTQGGDLTIRTKPKKQPKVFHNFSPAVQPHSS